MHNRFLLSGTALAAIALTVLVAIALGSGSSPSFSFSSDESGITYTCQLDSGTASACSSPKIYSNLAPGAHTETIVGSFTVSAPPPSSSLLVGDSAIETTVDSNGSTVQAWQYTAAASGTAASISGYVNAGSATVSLGLYSDASGRPGSLLDSGTIATPQVGWNTATLSKGVSVTSGTKYWLAWVGNDSFRDRVAGTCSYALSASTSLAATFSTSGSGTGFCPASLHVDGSSPPSTSTSTTSTSTSTAPPPPASSIVSATGQPPVTCATTLNPGDSVQNALAGAAPGAVVCLNGGNWAKQTITNITQGVTLAAAPGAVGQVNMVGLATIGTVSNLTVEGLKLSQGVFILGAAASDTFQNNTLEGWGASDAQSDSAFLLFPGDTGTPGSAVHGISMLYNQIDNVPQCLQDDTNGANTFSHNVCGPGIGNGGSPDVHYTQTDGLNGETINNNAFEGPLAAGAAGHVNVTHLAGSNDQFSNNILWHVRGNQHVQWNDDFASSSLTVNNNLDVEDPAQTGGAFEQIANNFGLTGFAQATNTVVGARGETAADYTIMGSPGSCTVSNNIGVGNPANGSFSVAASCASSSNAADDGTGNVTWTPAWQNTTWTPNAGSPWNPPPADYYKPVIGSGVTSGMGYQGAIGP